MTAEEDARWLDHADLGWTKIRLPHMVMAESFVSGDASERRLAVRYYRRDAERTLIAKVLIGPAAQGPPGHAHGGSMAALLDEAMGGAAWMNGHPVVAAELTARFRAMLPLNSRVIVEAWVQSVEGRKVRTRGVLRSEDGRLYAEGEALFITMDPKKFGALVGEAARMFGESGEAA